jgi:hypothetical protein
MIQRESNKSSNPSNQLFTTGIMIQNLNTPFYKKSKYQCSSHALWQTPISLYNQCIQIYSNIQTTSELFLIPKKYAKHQTKPHLPENLHSANKPNTLSRLEVSRLLKTKKQQAAYNLSNNPNYNPYSPLIDAEASFRQKKPNMANRLARINFRTMLNSANTAAKTANPTDSSTTKIQPNTDDIDRTIPSNQGTKIPTTENTMVKLTTNELLYQESDTYAPKQLAMAKSTPVDHEKFKSNKDISFALVFRIGQKKTETLQFNEGRILTSIITSFKNVMPYIRITPMENKRATAIDIESPEDIIFDNEFYSNYMENPTFTKNRQLVFRLHFISKKPFFWYKKNIHLQHWLKNAMIRIEENNITEIHCPKVGFLTDCHPRISLIATYEDRIKRIFKDIELPEFYCAIENISVRNATTKVIVIRSADTSVNRFLSLFRTATQDNINTFIPWNQWIAMIPGKQLDLIQRQNNVLTNIKSIILSGFKNDDTICFNYSSPEMDNSIMDDDEDYIPAVIDEKYGNMTVSEFIRNKYLDINGEPIVQFCYPVSLGILELNVNSIHAHQAIHLCKTIKEDMLMYMTKDAATAIFDDVKIIQEKAKTHSPWIPYDIETNYVPVESAENDDKVSNDRKKTKRTINHDSKTQSNYSYKTAVTHNITKETNNIPTSNNPLSATPSMTPAYRHTLTDEMTSLKSQLLDLQKTQKTFEEKSDAKTNKLIMDMQKMQNDNKCTKEEVTSIKNQMQEMTTKTWMENRFEKMDDKMDKVMDFMMHFMDSNNKKSAKIGTPIDEMNIDKELLKRSNHEISCDIMDNSIMYDDDKENYARGDNQINCNHQKSDYFGYSSP